MPKLLALAAAGVMLAGCGQSDRAEVLVPDPVAGPYLLETIQQKPLPAILIEANGYRLEVIGGSYELGADGSYSTSLTVRESIETVTSPNVVTYEERGSGVYSVAAQIVRFTDTAGREFTGQLAGGVLSFGGDLPRVYRR